MSSTFWRALRSALGPDITGWRAFNEDEAATRIASWKQQQQTTRPVTQQRDAQSVLKLPSGNVIYAMLQTCEPNELQALVDRHAGLAEINKAGAPDLFLGARDAQSRLCLA